MQPLFPRSAKRVWHHLLVAACLSLATSGYAQTPNLPEAASGRVEKPGWATHTYAVAAANPLATEAGRQMLAAGGSAVDAATAVQMVLALVEPQSSGIGGGAFLLHWDGKRVQAFDGRETAPAAATPSLFLKADGRPMGRSEAVVGGRSVGAPGAVAMLALAHAQHGRLPWKRLFQPAIDLSRNGFAVSPRLASLLAAERSLQKDPVAGPLYFDQEGLPRPVGYLLKNPELAAVLQAIAEEGSAALQDGDIAKAIVKAVQGHPTNPGALSLADLKAYQPIAREALCFDYRVPQPRHDYQVCGMPAPSSGAIGMAQILGMLQNTPAAQLPLVEGKPSGQWLHLYAEASRLAFADRAQYVGDPAFVTPPAGDWRSLLAPDYLAERALAIQTGPQGRTMGIAKQGVPKGTTVAFASMPDQIEAGTSHISVVDAYGNAIAMTTTVEDAFGARLMVNRGKGLAGGFLLNNQLTDFSFVPTDGNGQPIANRVEAGKRPRSAMAPTLVFDKASNRFLMSLGSPGGALIIHFTTKTLYGMLHWGLNAQEAINLPNFANMNGPTFLESGGFPSSTAEGLRTRGHTVSDFPMTSGLQAIQRTEKGWFGGADPRREGVVLGD